MSAAGDKLRGVVNDETAAFERCEVLLNGCIMRDIERGDDGGGTANTDTCFGFWLGFVWGTWC